MALTIAPNGLRPARKRGAGYNNNGQNKYYVANNVSNAIYQGGPVKVSTTGGIENVSATTDKVTGVFVGAKWVDPTSGQPVWDNKLAAGTSSAQGDIEAFVIDDPAQTYWIYADASVSQGDVGLNFEVTASGGGNATTGIAYTVLDASSRGQGGLLQVVGLAEVPNNAWSDPTPLVEVIIKRHADNFPVSASQ